MRTAALITAAGAGIRMGTDQPKQFLELGGRPILALALECFVRSSHVDGVVVVVPPGKVEYCRTEIVEKYGLSKVEKVVAGGKRRQDSVRLGLEAMEDRFSLVLIHDGVRPFVSPDLIGRIVTAAKRSRAVIPALAAKETIKETDREGLVVKTHDRSRLWLVQTPQAFRPREILEAHCRALEENWEEATDDALLAERMGIPVTVIEGTEENIKITTPRDLEWARFLWAQRGSIPRARKNSDG